MTLLRALFAERLHFRTPWLVLLRDRTRGWQPDTELGRRL